MENTFSHEVGHINLDELKELERKVEAYLKGHEFTDLQGHTVILCLHEFILNVIEHGTSSQDRGVVYVEISVRRNKEDREIEVFLKDSGKIFDIIHHLPLSKKQSGGLILIKSLAREVSWERDGDHNLTRFTIKA